MRAAVTLKLEAAIKVRIEAGLAPEAARKEAELEVKSWVKAEEAALTLRYEKELMNPREALSLGSISEIVMPNDLRATLAKNLDFFMRHYQPGPMTGIQREFH